MGRVQLREPVELGVLVQQVGESFRDRLAAQDVGLDLPPGPETTVSADAQRLRQLLQNLLENCVRYVDKGGQVRISLSRVDAEVVLKVEDSGPGVPEPERGLLFERFYRVERGRSRAGGGSGLGLAICKNIVEAHGGRIQAGTSALGGLVIEIGLPA